MHFELSTEQLQQLNAWLASRPEALIGAAGGRYSYIFTPCAIGLIITVKDSCFKTDNELDLTDYENW